MAGVLLPLPEGGAFMLQPTLSLVGALEAAGGSLFKTADLLVERALPLTDVLTLLQTIYRHEGQTVEAAFLLGVSPAARLAEVLTAILTPAAAMGAVAPGEEIPARAST